MKQQTVAANVARLAGEELMDRLTKNGDATIHQKDFGETVTNFDREINQFIIEELQTHFPEHDMITEEADEINSASESDRWFVDPIDGTNNFVRHIPLYAVSIGYEHDGELAAGAIYDPRNKELFEGSLEQGAFLGKNVLRVSDVTDIGNAMVMEGYGYDPKYKKMHEEILEGLSEHAKYRRNLGTAALMLAYVARGKADGLILSGIKAWDCAAGVVLVRAAGGKATNYKGEPWSPADDLIVASNGHVHDALLEIAQS